MSIFSTKMYYLKAFAAICCMISVIGSGHPQDSQSPNNTELQTRLQNLENRIAELANQVSERKHTATAGSGLTYVRWGRKTCPSNGTEMVYWGYVGGSSYEHKGAAANRLCLSSEPVWDSGIGTGGSAYLHGAEYENTFSGKATLNFDVPCAVCRVTTRTSVLMIPGRNVCYPGWTLEYHGRITAGDLGDNSASEYLCLDNDAESVNHSDDDDDGALFYHVAAQCTSLACPPYKHNHRFACAVCSL